MVWPWNCTNLRPIDSKFFFTLDLKISKFNIMGCICSKGVSKSTRDDVENQEKQKEASSSNDYIVPSSRKTLVENDGGDNEATMRLIMDGLVEEHKNIWEDNEKRKEKNSRSIRPQLQKNCTMDTINGNGGKCNFKEPKISRFISMPNESEAAQIAAGWPSWLTMAAGEAINGWIPRKSDSFERLEKIGQGTYSCVYKARDLESGKFVAMKKVRFVNMDPDSVRFMAREIQILRKLDHPNVMKLECVVTSRASGSIYLVFEYMEHDLAGLIARPGIKFTESQIKCFMQQLLNGLDHCHSRGMLHRDIKGSNLLIDNNGNLKIGDFGLATCLSSNRKQPLTSRVVTLWYRPPELLLGSTDYGVAVDLWSAGCILAELFHGKPIMPGRTEVEQIHKIFKLCGSPSEEYWSKLKQSNAAVFKPQLVYNRCVAETFKDFPSSTLTLLDILLAVEPEHRGTASMALESEFFTSEPLPCDPSTLPKFPPSKELDVRRRDGESKRNTSTSTKDIGHDFVKKDSRQSRVVPTSDVDVELQKRYGVSNKKIVNETFNHEENDGFGFHAELPKSVKHTLLSSQNPHDSKDDELTMEKKARRHFKFQRLSKLSKLNQTSSKKKKYLVHFQGRPKPSINEDEETFGNKAPTRGHPQEKWIHCSGPLLFPGGNIEDVIKEHEILMQNAIRKANIGKSK